MHLATLDILWVMPALVSIWWNARFVYWKPLSLWHSGCASGFAAIAARNVSNTNGLSLVSPDHIADNSSVIQIQNGTEIYLLYLNANVVLEFSNIRQPFLVRPVRFKFPVQQIVCQIIRISTLPGTAVVAVLNRGLNPAAPVTWVLWCRSNSSLSLRYPISGCFSWISSTRSAMRSFSAILEDSSPVDHL